MKLGLLLICALSAALPTVSKAAGKYEGKKVYFINSYHEGYNWPDQIVRGVKSVFKGTGIKLEVAYMDTKRQPSEEYKVAIGKKLKKRIDEWKPDLVIAADDNATKYVVVPYLKDSPIPVVFCGVNWDGKKYGYPFKNTTGMLEVELVDDLIRLMFKYSKRTTQRVGLIGTDNESERATGDIINTKYLHGKLIARYAKTFTEFKAALLDLEKNADVIYWLNHEGVQGWNAEEAQAFIGKNISIPIGTTSIGATRYAIIGLAKLGDEQGEWSAHTALSIFDGTPPASIPIAENKDAWLFVNIELASKHGVVFTPDLLKNATIFGKMENAKEPSYTNQKRYRPTEAELRQERKAN